MQITDSNKTIIAKKDENVYFEVVLTILAFNPLKV